MRHSDRTKFIYVEGLTLDEAAREMIKAGFDIKDQNDYTITTHREWQDIPDNDLNINSASYVRLAVTAFDEGVRFSILLTELGSNHEVRCYQEASLEHHMQRQIAIGWMYLEHFIDSMELDTDDVPMSGA